MGVEESTELTLVRRTVICLENLSISKYNKDYQCTVIKAEQIGERRLAVDFKVVGNMSYGRLQDPSHSRLKWPENGSAREIGRHVGSKVYTKEDWEHCIEGTLCFDDVPMDRTVHFRFGSSGYSSVPIKLGAESD